MSLIIDDTHNEAQDLIVSDGTSWRTDRINAMFYGPIGSGKTDLACRFPKPVLIDFAENGALTVKYMLAQGRLKEDIPIIKTTSPRVALEIAKDARGRLGVAFAGTKWEGYENEMETIICDTVTTLEGFVWEDVLKRAGKTDEESGIAQIESRASRMSAFFRAAWNSDLNTVLLGHDQPGRSEVRSGRGEVIMKEKAPGPLLTGKIAIQCPALVDILFYLRCEPSIGGEDEFVAYTRPHAFKDFPARNRMKAYLDARIVNPSYAIIREALNKLEKDQEERLND